MPNIYPNLPGISVDFNERAKQTSVTTRENAVPSLLILGTASDGPLFTPVAVGSAAEAEYVFGPAELPGAGRPNLSRAAWIAEKLGVQDIRLMKISGAYATGALSASPKTNVVQREMREELGQAAGNTETVITFNLSDASDVLKSTVVMADGLVLPSEAYNVEKSGASVTVTIAANATSSGVPVRVDYSFAHVVVTPVADEVLAPVADQVSLVKYFSAHQNWDPEAEVVIKKNGTALESTAYVVDFAAGVVTFTDPCLESDVITASYSYLKEEAPLAGSVAGVTSGAVQSFALSQVPEEGTFVLFTQDGSVPADGYTLSASLKTVALKSGYVKKGVMVSANYKYKLTVEVVPTVAIKSTGAAALYNDVTYAVQEVYDENGAVVAKEVVITKPARKRILPSEPALRYSSRDYATFGALVEAVNADQRNNVVRLSTSFPEEPTMSLVATAASVRLAGGDDGLNLSKYEFYKQLEGVRDVEGNLIEWGAYPLLENYHVDHVVLAGLYFDDDLGNPDVNFAQQLAQFCAVSSMFQNNVLGYIAVRPIAEPSLAEIATRVNATCALPHEFFMRNIKGELMKDKDGNNIDISKFVSIVTYPDFVATHPRLGQFVADNEVVYAAIAATTEPDFGTTWAPVSGLELRYEVSNQLRNKLVGAQYVCFENTWLEGNMVPVVTAGVTAAKAGSDYDSLHAMKVAIAATNLVRAASSPYIGKLYGSAKRQAHATAIERALESLVSRGSLASFTYSLHIDPTSRALREGLVELNLITNPELRQLHVFVTIAPAV